MDGRVFLTCLIVLGSTHSDTEKSARQLFYASPPSYGGGGPSGHESFTSPQEHQGHLQTPFQYHHPLQATAPLQHLQFKQYSVPWWSMTQQRPVQYFNSPQVQYLPLSDYFRYLESLPQFKHGIPVYTNQEMQIPGSFMGQAQAVKQSQQAVKSHFTTTNDIEDDTEVIDAYPGSPNKISFEPKPVEFAGSRVKPVQQDSYITPSAKGPKPGAFNRAAVESDPHAFRTGPLAYQQGSDLKVICYFANWGYYRKGPAQYIPENVDPKICTHVIYAFATFDKGSLVLKSSDPGVDLDKNRFYERVVYLKQKNPALKVLLAVGGWSDSNDNKYSVMAGSAPQRLQFAQQAVGFLKKYGFDGLSIDWHYPVCWQSDCSLGPRSDKYSFNELIRELKEAFRPQGLLVVASLSGYKEVIDIAYDVPTLSRNLDFMNIMTYDYHGSWESRTGHLSPLYEGHPSEDQKPTYNSNFTMEYYVSKGADRSKLIMGIPFYGQSFTLENQFDSALGSLAVGAGNPGEQTQQPGMLAYYEICKKIRDGWSVRKDTSGSWGPYAYKDNQWVGFDDVDFVRRKARYVKGNGFGGAFVFTVDLDDFNNDCCSGDQPLLRSLAKELLGIPFNLKKEDCIRPPPPIIPDLSSPSLPTSTVVPPVTPPVVSTTPPPESSTNGSLTGGFDTTPKPENQTYICPPCSQIEVPTQGTTTPKPCRPEPQKPTPPQQVVPANPNPSGSGCNYKVKENPANCNSYFECISNTEMERKCPKGLYFNKDTSLCDWPKNVKCKATSSPGSSPTIRPTPPPITTTTKQTSPTTGSTTSEPEDDDVECVSGEYFEAIRCDQYYICSLGKKKLQMCGPGLHWNSDKKLCDWPEQAKCELRSDDDKAHADDESDSECQEGVFYGSPQECDVYFVCVHGKRVQFRCQPGLYWNEKAKVCDWPANVDCTPGEGTSSTTPSPSTSTTTTEGPVPTPPMTTTTPRPVKPQPDPGPPPPSTLSGDFKIVCYFTNWAWYRPGLGKYMPADINPDLCTHIVYGFAVLDYETLTIKPHDTWADLDNKFYEQVTALKARGKKVTVAIGGWNDSAGDKYSRLVNNPAARRRFIQTVMEFIKKYNFDGLDLDWEYPKCWQVECNKGPDSDKPSFAAFVKELSIAFRPQGLLLSSAVSPSKTVIDVGYDVPTLSRYFDWIAVMTYDFHGQWDKKTGHVAPLYFHEEDDFYFFNTNYSINYWINQGADRRKIIMGMPLYGQSFTLANPAEHGLNAPSIGGGTAGEFTRASGFLAYYEICANIQRSGWTVVQDPAGAMGPYAYKGNQWVSYDDVAMIQKKSKLIRDLDIGGGMIWALDLDDFRNSCGQGPSPLLSNIRAILGPPRRSSGSQPQRPASTPQQQVPPPQQAQPETEKPFPVIIPVIKTDEIEYCNNDYKPHETDCSRYYQCQFGRYVEQQCSPGTQWNVDHCDWPSNTNCKNGVRPPSEQPTPRPTQSPTTTAIPTIPTTSWTTTTTRPPYVPPPAVIPPGPTSPRPPKYSTTPIPTRDPDWCRLNWCPTPKPIPENKHPQISLPPSDYKVVCYFTNWAWYRPGLGKYKPEDIDFNLCTHIAYGFAVLNPETLVIRPHDSWADIDNQFYKQVVQLRQRGIKVVLALGGWNDSKGDKYSRLVHDAGARRRFIDHAIEFIEIWDFDGLDLDWEYPKCWQVECDKGPDSDKQAFATFVREIKEAFEPRGLLLSSAVSPNKKVIDLGYDVPIVNKYMDWIAVMTYDYHGQWDKKTGHNAPLYHHPESTNEYFNGNYSINYWIENGADRRKIVMGMPLYGQSFTIVNSSNTGLNSVSSGGAQAGPYTRSAGFLAYYEICSNIQERGWTVVQDPYGAIGPYAYKGNQWVSFDDVAQIRKKAQYIKAMGLGGGMIWALDLDDFRGSCGCEEHPLLKTINRELRRYPGPDPNCQLKIRT